MLVTKIAMHITYKQGELCLWGSKLNCYNFPECKQKIRTNKVKIGTLSIYSKEIFRGLYVHLPKKKAYGIIYISGGKGLNKRITHSTKKKILYY